MQPFQRLRAATVLTAVLIAVPTAASAAPATSWAPRAGARSWTTVGTFGGGTHQACKVPVNDGASWRIYNRLVNGRQGRVTAGMTVARNGKETARTWSSGLIARGATSAVGSVTLPKGDPAFTLVVWQSSTQAGTGAELRPGQIGRC